MAFERYKSTTTSLEVMSYTGNPFYIRSFCDDPTGGVYTTKEPVCILSLDPIEQYTNTNIAWDISGSSSASGTIDAFWINWGGATSSGSLSNQDWASDPKSGNVQFTTAGEYVVTAYVKDTLGNKSKEYKAQVTIITAGNFPDLPGDGSAPGYVGSNDDGCHKITPGGASVASNTGLSGGHLIFRAMRLHPGYEGLPDGQRHVWACTQDGLAYSLDGAANWTTIDKSAMGTPTNDAGDGTPPVTGDLDQIDLCFDPQDPKRVYVLRTTATRTWVYYTDDYGSNWSNVQVYFD